MQDTIVNSLGALPVQGNVGRFVAGSTSFKPDLFTSEDTCGAGCAATGTAAYGIQDFGFRTNSKDASHALDTFKSVRVADFTRGSSADYGCRTASPPQRPGVEGPCASVIDIPNTWSLRPPAGFLNRGA